MEDNYLNSRDECRNLPIFRKGIEILDTVKVITDLFPEDNEMLQFMKQNLLSSAPRNLSLGLNRPNVNPRRQASRAGYASRPG